MIITVPPSAVAQQVKVKVLEFRDGKMRIGFDAERNIVIHREEIQRVVDLETAQ